MFGFFKSKKFDLSSPSTFSKSIEGASGKLASIFSTDTWIEISQKPNARAYMEVLEGHAEAGNNVCQELVAQWNIMLCEETADHDELKFGLRKAIKFGAMAAESGICSEALNLPISLSKLGQLLMDESDGTFTDEIESIFVEMYRWSIKNSENPNISASERAIAAQTASELYAGMPELFAHAKIRA